MSTNKLAKYGLSDDFSGSSVTWPAVKIRAYHNSAEYKGPLRDTRCSFFEVNPKILNKRLDKSKKIVPYRASFVKPQPDAVWEKVTAPFNYQREESLLSPSPSPETNRKVHILMEYNRQNGRKTHVEMEYSTVLKALAAKGITHPPKKPSQRTPLQPVGGNSRVTKTKPVKQESSFDRPLFDSVVAYGKWDGRIYSGTTHPLRKSLVPPPPPDAPIIKPNEPAPILQLPNEVLKMIVLNFEAPEYFNTRILLSITHTLFAIVLRRTFRSKSFWFYPNWNGFYCRLDSRRDSFLLCQPMADYMPKDMRYCRICDMWKRIEPNRERRKNNKTRRDHLGPGPRRTGDHYDMSEACRDCLDAYREHASQGHDIRECEHRLCTRFYLEAVRPY